MTVVATIEQLEAIYGFPNDASTVKVADWVTPAYRALMDKSPFAALATCGPEGLDCSPRGDLPGFVRIHDEEDADDAGSPRQQPLRLCCATLCAIRGWRCCFSSGLRQHAAQQRPRACLGQIRNCSRRSRWRARRRAPSSS